MMLTFDTPIPFNSIGRRNVSNVPAQALILMNDPFVSDQARKWATRLLKDHPDEEIRLKTAFIEATGREPTDEELNQLIDFLADLRQKQKLDELESWSSLCHVLFNTKEFIFIK